MTASTIRRHVCSEKPSALCSADCSGSRVRCAGSSVDIPGGSRGFGIFSQMRFLYADRSEMSRMRFSACHSRSAASASRGGVQVQCSFSAFNSVPAASMLFVGNEKTPSGAVCWAQWSGGDMDSVRGYNRLVDYQKHFSILKIKILPLHHGIDLWCNGSTTDFGSVCRGSNPLRSTETHEQIFFHNFTFFDDYTRSYQRV